jgi:hypothetical protein
MAAQFNAFRTALAERRLRANPAFELVLHDRLPEPDRRLLADLESDPEHYGLLRPRPGSGLGLRAVDRDTALLFLTLGQAGRLPAYVRARLGGQEAGEVVARLVADGILEVEAAPGAERFLWGPAAFAALTLDRQAAAPALGVPAAAVAFDMPAAVPPAGASGRIAELSRAALVYGQELARTVAGIEPLHLSLRLYVYHRLPLTPRWRRELPTADAVRRYLGVGEGGAWRALAGRYWSEQPAAAAASWLWWRRAAAPSAGAAPAAGDAAAARPTYKLYVSPLPEALPHCFGRILDGLAAAGAPSLKLGAAAGGLLRPDKIVAYFASFEELAAAAASLEERLAGLPAIPAHGVPFSSEIGAGGLLSWGIDPPPEDLAGLPGGGRQSWRLWLTHRLARALLAGVAAGSGGGGGGAAGAGGGGASGGGEGGAAGAGGGGISSGGEAAGSEEMEPWRFALVRLTLDGVDTASWTPGGRLWRRPAAEAAAR